MTLSPNNNDETFIATDSDGDKVSMCRRRSTGGVSMKIYQKSVDHGTDVAAVYIENGDVPALIDFLQTSYKEEVACDTCKGSGKVTKS